MRSPAINSRKGFTIVELLIASTILTTILVAASFVLVQIGRLYYKGVITARTQDAARNITDAISRPVQLEGAKVVNGVTAANPGDWNVVCLGGQRFSYKTNVLATNIAGGEVFLKDRVRASSDCNSPAVRGADVESLLSNNMQLLQLTIAPSGVDNTIDIKVVVAYGRDVEGNETTGFRCVNQVSSSQWCAVATYSTRIFPRLGQ